jgi:hypothetical protein
MEGYIKMVFLFIPLRSRDIASPLVGVNVSYSHTLNLPNPKVKYFIAEIQAISYTEKNRSHTKFHRRLNPWQ